jgi:hypothetical protein
MIRNIGAESPISRIIKKRLPSELTPYDRIPGPIGWK